MTQRHQASSPPRMLLALSVALLLLAPAALAFAPSTSRMPCWQRGSQQYQQPSRARSGRLTPRCAVQVNRVTSSGEAEAITDFFVENFWDAPISKPKQRQQLSQEVFKDLTTRYMTTKAKPAGGKSALLVAKDGGRVVGCVGLETRVVRDGQVTKLESLKGDTPGASLQPVIANLAVDRSIRRKGIGAKILRECERVAKGWGFQELWLVVDEKNKPARALYERSGFELMGREPRGVKVVPTEWQLREVPVTNLCMCKDLTKAGTGGGGGLGALFGGLFGGR